MNVTSMNKVGVGVVVIGIAYHRGIEIFRTVQKELTALGKKQRERIVDIELCIVRFNLRKIGVECRIQNHVFIDAPAQVGTRLKVRIIAAPCVYRGLGPVLTPERSNGWNDLQVGGLLEIGR